MTARDTAGVIAPPPLLALAAVVFGLLLDGLFPAYVLTVLLTLAQRIEIAVPLFAIAAALGVPAVLAFRKAGTHVEPGHARHLPLPAQSDVCRPHRHGGRAGDPAGI
jgi:hypothetical protein